MSEYPEIMRKTAMPCEALRNVNSIAKLLKSTEFPDRFAISEWDFPKLDVVGSNPIARFRTQTLERQRLARFRRSFFARFARLPACKVGQKLVTRAPFGARTNTES